MDHPTEVAAERSEATAAPAPASSDSAVVSRGVEPDAGATDTAAAQLEAEWAERYAALPAETLRKRAEQIDQRIVELTKSEFERRFELGMGRQIGERGVYTGEDYVPGAVSWVKILDDGRVLRLTLPPEEFPDAYALKAESVWLKDQAWRLER